VALYYGVLAFNVGMTLWIGEAVLAATGMLIHVALFLLLYRVGASRVVSPQRGEVGERTRSEAPAGPDAGPCTTEHMRTGGR
jgi:hypothetical protein